MHILLAEDDKNITLILQLVLEKLGKHQVTLAENGQVALEKALNNEFDLILLDGMMPKMTGLEVLRTLSKELDQRPPVIYLSAKTDQKDLDEIKTLGAGHIQKPFDPEKINQRIADFLEGEKKQAS